MFVEFTTDRDWSGYDFTIIGAGVAGLYLAQRLAGIGKVLVFEAGGKTPGVGDGYYDLEVSGRNYGTLGQRLSCFGGTSNHWGGHSRPLAREVFANRPGIPGWPIAYEAFSYYLPEGQKWLNLVPFNELMQGKTSVETGILAGQQELDAVQFQFSNPITRLGDAPTLEKFAAAPNIDVVLDTRVTDMAIGAGGTRIATLAITHLPSKQTGTVPVKTAFVCTGGIENARLLLWAGRKYAKGNPLLGGQNELTGKFFMEHPSIMPVDIYFDRRADLSALYPEVRGPGMTNVVMRPSDGFLEKHGLPRFGMHFQDRPEIEPTAAQLGNGPAYFLTRSPGYQRIWPFFIFEQTPTATSYVALSDKLGTDGTPLARLNWEILADDIARFRKGVILMCGLLNQNGFAKSRLTSGYGETDWSGVDIGNASHQMGTTRMANDSAAGVVDTDCKVFGLDNLYVAGSSVFPNTDYVNPTMNFMALTVRLADLIIGRARAVGAIYRYGAGRDENAALISGWGVPDNGGVWTSGAEAVMKISTHRAKTMRFFGHANGDVTMTLTVNGMPAFAGPAKQLFATDVPISGGDTADVEMNFSGTSATKTGSLPAGAGIYLQRLVLK